jgi:hypothetical protein
MSDLTAMETLSEAIDRLREDGYRDSLRATGGGFVSVDSGEVNSPERLVVEEVVRFEGASNPADEAVLFALRARDDAFRGTFVTSFSAENDPVAVALVRRLDDDRKSR